MAPSSRSQEGFSYAEQQFGWDSYFNARLLMLYGDEHFNVVTGMLDNALDMYDQFGINPNSSLYIRLGHGQPPYLTSYAFDIYNTYKDTHPEINETWLSNRIATIKREYWSVWMGTQDPHNRLVYQGLSRYYDVDVTDDHVQAESGWDYNPRFDGQAQNYLPVDLNALLYKYEMDFAREAFIRRDMVEARYWVDAAQMRKETMNRLMYDPERGLFHDYNYITGEWGPVASAASYVTMWAGMVKPHSEQAHQMVRALKNFERLGGLAVTEEFEMPSWERRKLQWAFPNAWSPVTLMTTDGLERTGFPEDARRIALKSLKTKVDYHAEHGVILEAYNAAFPRERPIDGLYPRQVGFGWTDAEIEYYAARYVEGRHLSSIALQNAGVLLDNRVSSQRVCSDAFWASRPDGVSRAILRRV